MPGATWHPRAGGPGVRRLALALALLAALVGVAAAQDLALEVVPDPRAAPPHPQEMVLITIRGLYSSNIAIEVMDTPVIEAFGWTQLGHDTWFDDRRDGRAYRVFERRMAVFPERAGVLTLPPFVHRLVLAEPGGARVAREVRSAPVAIEVAPPPPTPGWWLPVADLRATDTWAGHPAALALGETATRTVVLEARGIGADRLPPMPDLRRPDIFAFPLPEQRSVELTPEGPVARVVWRWSVIPEGPRPVVMPPLTIPWFDTVARAPRALVLAPQVIAIDGAVLGDDPHDGRMDALGVLAGPVGLGLGAALGLALALRGLRLRRDWGPVALRLRRALALWRLRRAARTGDAVAARAAARAYAAGRPGAVALLAGFDRLAYGRPGGADTLPDLVALLRRC